MEAVVMAEEDLDRFVRSASEGFSVFGPKKKDVTHVFGEIKSGREMDLKYRTTILPPKKIFHPPRETLFYFSRKKGFSIDQVRKESRKVLLLGVHACDLNAILRLDKFFTEEFRDALYLDRRKSSAIVALNCTEIGENCFCHSMGTGPESSAGFDLSMTDLGDRYLAEIGTDLGRRLLHPLELPRADRRDFEEKDSRLANAKKKFKKFVDKEGLANAAAESFDHPIWRELAEIDLSCGSCSLVCPTCYCYDVLDQIDLSLSNGERLRELDSCQLLEYASVAMGGNFRGERKDRMRQWMLCKLRYTGKEHGFSGCVGCGRCIGACTVHIDITQVAVRIKGG
ncbi:MAG: 4Fe-4S dicluster domain-containing protein [Aigarchaeota archaeon]|nr:4Fe-4S dicluster domain-containing protein [Aigarchaeota archaeon]MDH5703243.1 4Fe-4S dicluster domain-containing protein [Aigarchaeota archaeon]